MLGSAIQVLLIKISVRIIMAISMQIGPKFIMLGDLFGVFIPVTVVENDVVVIEATSTGDAEDGAHGHFLNIKRRNRTSALNFV